MENAEKEISTVKEEICIRCKGTGRCFIKDRVWGLVKGIGWLIAGFILMIIGGGIIGIIVMLFGIFSIMMSQLAKCRVCNGTGKVILSESEKVKQIS